MKLAVQGINEKQGSVKIQNTSKFVTFLSANWVVRRNIEYYFVNFKENGKPIRLKNDFEQGFS